MRRSLSQLQQAAEKGERKRINGGAEGKGGGRRVSWRAPPPPPPPLQPGLLLVLTDVLLLQNQLPRAESVVRPENEGDAEEEGVGGRGGVRSFVTGTGRRTEEEEEEEVPKKEATKEGHQEMVA